MLISGVQFADFDFTFRRRQSEVAELRRLSIRDGFEGQIRDAQARFFVESQLLQIQVQRVVLQRIQNRVSADVGGLDVIGRKLSRNGRDIAFVIRHAAASDDQRMDAQVERRFRRLFRGQRVEHELEIVRLVSRLLVEVRIHAEQLRRRNHDFPFQQRQIVDFRRQSRRFQQLFALLVADVHIVDGDSVEKAQIHAPHAHFRPQFFRQRVRRFRANKLLYRWHAQQYDRRNEQSDDRPQCDVGDFPHFFQNRLQR